LKAKLEGGLQPHSHREFIMLDHFPTWG